MADKTIEFKLKITDVSKGAVQKVQAELEDVDDVVKQITSSAVDSVRALNKAATAAFSWNQIHDAVSGVNDLLQSITAPAQQFEQSMRAVNTMAGKGEKEFRAMSRQIASLSREIPLARDLLAKGLYQVISNGVPEDNWLSFLEQSAKSAVGGMADLEQVVTVTSTVIKNYGLAWDSVTDIQDKIQLTAQYGVTSFEQLAAALPRVTGNAATLGVSIDELLATFATLTGVSGNTAEVSTQLAAVFTALVKPSGEATKMAEQMGIAFDAVSIKAAGGLLPFLTQLDNKITAFAAKSGMIKESIYSALFGSAESLRALIPLTGELSDKFSQNVANMQQSVGTIDGAFAQMNSTTEAARQRFKNLTVGLSDLINKVIGGATPFVEFGAAAAITITQFAGARATIKALSSSIASTRIAIVAKTAAMRIAAVMTRTYRTAMQTLTAAMHGAKAAATTLAAVLTLGLSIAITVAIEALSRLKAKREEQAEAQKLAQQQAAESERQYKESITRSASEQIASFELLKTKWADLGNNMSAKRRFIIDNKDAFGQLGINIRSVNDAENLLVRNTQSVISAIMARARANAAQNKVEEVAAKIIELEDNKNRMLGSDPDTVIDTSRMKEGERQRAEMINRKRKTIRDYYDQLIAAERANMKRYVDMVVAGNKAAEEAIAKALTKPKATVVDTPDTVESDSTIKIKARVQIEPDQINVNKIMAEINEEADNFTVPYVQNVDVETDAEKAVKGINAVSSAMSNLSQNIGGAAGNWLQWGINCLQAISRAIPAIAALTAADRQQATAALLGMSAEAGKSVAWIPVVGAALAVAAIASVVGAMASIPKYAAGGIAYGPTMGIFGEYANAASNPEVVAPLDRLQALLQPEGKNGKVEFEIRGDKLVGMYDKMARHRSRT